MADKKSVAKFEFWYYKLQNITNENSENKK